DVKAGHEHVEAPVYSHLTYDILEDEREVVEQPDVLIVEGLNVLQPARPRRDGRLGMAVSDFFDFFVYVDARMEDVQRWYVNRFLQLRQTAFSDPRSYFRLYADLTDEEAVETAVGIWRSINGPNLRENVVPTRGRADLVLRKDGQHRVHSVLLRKVRSEEHTSELQSRFDLVCRLLLEKKNRDLISLADAAKRDIMPLKQSYAQRQRLIKASSARIDRIDQAEHTTVTSDIITEPYHLPA